MNANVVSGSLAWRAMLTMIGFTGLALFQNETPWYLWAAAVATMTYGFVSFSTYVVIVFFPAYPLAYGDDYEGDDDEQPDLDAPIAARPQESGIPGFRRVDGLTNKYVRDIISVET